MISVLSFYVCCLGGKGMRRCIPFDFFCFLIMFVVWGARECADAFLLISVLFSYNVCCLGARECADGFLLISVLFSYNVCCLGGKGMRRCIPFDFCSVFL